MFSSLLAVAHGIYILSAETLIAEALNAYEIGEVSQKAQYHYQEIRRDFWHIHNIQHFYVGNVRICRHVALKVYL